MDASTYENELFDPPQRVEDSETYKVFGTDYIVTMPWSDTEWKMGPIQQERYRNYEYSKHGSVEELCALCVATQVWGPSVGRKAVMKLKIQTSPWSIGAPERTYPHAIGQEFENLERLTDGKCSCTPQLIDFYIFTQTEEDFVPGGYFAVTLMEKVPGRNLRNFGDFPLEKRNRVRMAFAKAMREFLSFGIQHFDTGRRNVLWDDESERCFIIDLEDAEYGGSPIKFHPFSEFCQWRLNSPHERGDNLEDDPMIPSAEEYYDYVDSDEALMALAARTENASRAESLKRQTYHAMEDESKLRMGRRDPLRVGKMVAKFGLVFRALDIIMCGRNCYVTDTGVWYGCRSFVLANVTAGLVLY